MIAAISARRLGADVTISKQQSFFRAIWLPYL